MANERVRELISEFRGVTAGRGPLIDAILTPMAYLMSNAMGGQDIALWVTLSVPAALVAFRLIRRERVGYALGGLGAALVALGVARLSGADQGYLIPDLISGGVTLMALVASVALRRPLVAWTSHLARGWPRSWYWHPRVLPAYNEVTLAWGLYYAARLLTQYWAFLRADATLVGLVKLISGWPATIVLLVLSYLYGTWRLRTLAGPSIDEFRNGVPPPWTGQTRGF